MNKNAVLMTAIYHELELKFKVYNANQDKPPLIQRTREEIAILHEAYFELRGRRGTVSGILGMDNEPNSVDSIYVLTRENKENHNV